MRARHNAGGGFYFHALRAFRCGAEASQAPNSGRGIARRQTRGDGERYQEGGKMDVKILFRTIIAMAIVSLGTLLSMAQTSTGEVTGTISDQQGAFVAQAKVTLTNSATGVKRETVTNDAGRFNFTAVSTSGTYTVAVEAPGFRNLVQGEIS